MVEERIMNMCCLGTMETMTFGGVRLMVLEFESKGRQTCGLLDCYGKQSDLALIPI